MDTLEVVNIKNLGSVECPRKRMVRARNRGREKTCTNHTLCWDFDSVHLPNRFYQVSLVLASLEE